MGEVTKAGGGNVPAHISNLFGDNAGWDALSQGVGGGYPHLSYRGKNWHVVRGDDRELVKNEDGDPKSSIEVVLLRANAAISKIYYSGGYVEGTSEKPTCYSNDGVVPAADSTERQAQKCAVCPHNQWGSRISDAGAKGKNCSDSRRLAVAPINDLENPMLLRVPAASLKDLSIYGEMLKRRRTPPLALVTKISFDPDAAYPKFIFKATRWLSEEEATVVVDVSGRDLVETIISSSRVEVEAEPDALGPAPAHVAALTEPEPKAAPKAKAKAHVTAEVVGAVVEDDPPFEVATQPKAEVKPSVLVAGAEKTLEEALGELDWDES